MKKIITIIFLILGPATFLSQTTFTLNKCYEKSRANYPLIKQKDYVAKSKEFSVSNVWKGYFPQITISGQATFQSDVTSLPISIPGIKIESLTNDFIHKKLILKKKYVIDRYCNEDIGLVRNVNLEYKKISKILKKYFIF